MDNTVIRVENLSKLYRVGQFGGYNTLMDSLGSVTSTMFRRLRSSASRKTTSRNSDSNYIWALNEVSFEVKQGEVLGIIGRNGAGKSTLLKVLSRITAPTGGYAEIWGRIGSLLEVGTGFHPELTGRENVYLNGAILGMKKAEIDRKFDEIVDFSEIRRFIDTPVKRYSDGMRVRLAFSVASHLDPEILLVDEVLAVGDAMFREKCLGKMTKVASEGRTVLFVSHLMQAVEMLCSRVILLEEGKIILGGEPSEVIRYYLGDKGDETSAQDKADFAFPDNPDKSAQIKRLRIFNARGELTNKHSIMEPIKIEIDFELRDNNPTLFIESVFHRVGGFSESYGQGSFLTTSTDWENYERGNDNLKTVFPLDAGIYSATINIPAPFFNAGAYEIELYLTTGPQRQDTCRNIFFEIEDKGSFASIVRSAQRSGFLAYPLKWEIVKV